MVDRLPTDVCGSRQSDDQQSLILFNYTEALRKGELDNDLPFDRS